MSSKYAPLEIHLRNSGEPVVSMTFQEVESVVGTPLPRSAFTYRAWWGNQMDVTNRPQARAWIRAGYLVEDVQQHSNRGSVRFRRAR
jgi:hypothetical protein